MNTLVKDKSGYIFELQFHTPKSFEIKEGELYKLYEKQRALNKKREKEQWDILEKMMIDLSKTIPNPKDIERIF